MAVVKYDVSGVESGGGGEQPQPGLYAGQVASITARTEKANGDPVRDLEVIIDVGSEYVRLWTYVKTPDDSSYNEAAHGWKLRELTDALKLPSKGSFDTSKQIGKKVNVKVVADTNLEGEYRGRIRSVFAPGKIEETGEGVPDGEADEPYTAEELEDWSAEDLKEELQERGLSLTGRFSAAKAISAILSDQDSEGEEAEEAPSGRQARSRGADASDTDGGEDSSASYLDPALVEDLRTEASFYEDWADDDIKAYADDLGITGNVSGRKTRAKYIDAITSLAESVAAVQDGAGEDSGSGDGEPDDYDEWTLDELKDEIATRNEQDAEIKITGRQTKEKLVAALRDDDKVAEPF